MPTQLTQKPSATRPSFTLAECNAMLPLVQTIAAEVIERRQQRKRLLRDRESLERSPTPEGLTRALTDLDARIHEQEDGVRRACKELSGYGLTVLRLNPLTIHFPGRTRTNAMVFCWQEGDGAVTHGHPCGQEQNPRHPLKVKATDSPEAA